MPSSDSDSLRDKTRHSRFVVEHPERADAEITVTFKLSYRDAWTAATNLGALDDVEACRSVRDALHAALAAHRQAAYADTAQSAPGESGEEREHRRRAISGLARQLMSEIDVEQVVCWEDVPLISEADFEAVVAELRGLLLAQRPHPEETAAAHLILNSDGRPA